MIHPLIIGTLKETPSRLLHSTVVIAIATTALLTQITLVHASPQAPHQALIAHWISNMFGIVFWVSFAIAVLMKYVDIGERNRDFGILRILGASGTYIATLLLQEILLESLPGALLGLLLTYIASNIFKVLLGSSIKIPIAYLWWPAVAAIATCAPIIGAITAIPKAIQEGIAEAL